METALAESYSVDPRLVAAWQQYQPSMAERVLSSVATAAFESVAREASKETAQNLDDVEPVQLNLFESQIEAA